MQYVAELIGIVCGSIISVPILWLIASFIKKKEK